MANIIKKTSSDFISNFQASRIHFSNVTHKISPEFIKDFNFSYLNVAKGHKVNCTFFLMKPLDTVIGQFLLETKQGAGKTYMKIVDYKLSACDALKVVNKISILKEVVMSIIKSANFQLRCPFKKVKTLEFNMIFSFCNFFTCSKSREITDY